MAAPGKEEVQKPYQGQCCGIKSGARSGGAPRHDFEAGFSCCLKSVGSIVLHAKNTWTVVVLGDVRSSVGGKSG